MKPLNWAPILSVHQWGTLSSIGLCETSDLRAYQKGLCEDGLDRHQLQGPTFI